MAVIGFVVCLVVVIAGGAAYAQMEKPEFCGSCHAMSENYGTWSDSSHASVTCSECHLPNNNIAAKLVAKAQTGMVDVWHQTMRDYDLNIEMTDKGKTTLRNNCIRCHEPTIKNTSMIDIGKDGDDRYCVSCHRNLVHGNMTIPISQ
ncbi:MAG: NapC/NirT family cytochrome c [Peptococcaceae bacterium]|nr:NapC/NirT family cytochrome c [Peptococcaceae bacterium]